MCVGQEGEGCGEVYNLEGANPERFCIDAKEFSFYRRQWKLIEER